MTCNGNEISRIAKLEIELDRARLEMNILKDENEDLRKFDRKRSRGGVTFEDIKERVDRFNALAKKFNNNLLYIDGLEKENLDLRFELHNAVISGYKLRYHAACSDYIYKDDKIVEMERTGPYTISSPDIEDGVYSVRMNKENGTMMINPDITDENVCKGGKISIAELDSFFPYTGPVKLDARYYWKTNAIMIVFGNDHKR